jgi:hypothetical protein
MAKDPKRDWYWPLGALDYALEIEEDFPDEAQLLGIITILWNRQEMALKRLFKCLLSSNRPAFAESIWDRQSTHQARRDLLALALQTVKLTKRQRGILGWIIENTKTLADRRNELIHAEYVVHGRTNKLHAKVKAPRSNKPAKHQKASASDLQKVVNDLCFLVQATEAAWSSFWPRSMMKMRDELRRLEKVLGPLSPLPRSPQSDSAPPSAPRKPRAARKPPPQPSEA